jgi:stage II sporulation protein AB (anti-sigma F factor)
VQGSSEHSWRSLPENVGAARRAALEAAKQAGANREAMDAIRIAVSEAVSNVVVHGYRGAPDGTFTMALQAENGALQVIVRDEGCGMRPRTDSPGAGLGLPLIARLAATVSVTSPPDGGTEVAMTFPLREPAHA